MIFVGNQRGGAKNLATHLLNARENEHVEVHEVRGFASDSVHGAFNEAYAMSKGTKCNKFLYSLSINPPQDKDARIQDFEEAANRAEERLGLTGQPRVIVFHEKNGRRHAHAVWSRIDSNEMKAIPLSYDHPKLQEVSRELHIAHGWQMPRGMIDKSLRDPKNFTLDEWQQAKRQGKDPRAIKTAIQDAWATSDSRIAFSNALKDRGYTLARGDRRGFVALDRKGEVFAIGKKWLGIKTKDIKTRLGDPKGLPDVDTAKAQIAIEMQATISRLRTNLDKRSAQQKATFDQRKADFITRQKAERKSTFEILEARRISEVKTRQMRFRHGMKGLWDRLRGEHKRIQEQNEREAYQAYVRYQAAKDALVFQQLQQRRNFEHFRQREEGRTQDQAQDLKIDACRYRDMRSDRKDESRREFIEQRQSNRKTPDTRDGPALER